MRTGFSTSKATKTKTKRTRTTTTEGEKALFALGLGANLGNREAVLRGALAALGASIGPLRVSDLYRTRPLGNLPQPDYLNAVALGHTTLPPAALLAIGKQLERLAGRRLDRRHTPRPLDVDLLLWGDRVIDRPELRVPHPELRRRRFVLEPLAELAPGLEVPPDGKTVSALLAAVGQEEDVKRAGWGGRPSPGSAL